MRTNDFTTAITAKALNESMFKKFGVKINFDKYGRDDLENYRNLLRTKVHAQESQSNFNSLLNDDTYQKDKYMLDLLNTKIKEMIGESKGSKVKEEMKVGDKKKSSTGGTIEKTSKGVKHTAGNNYGAEKQPFDKDKKSKKVAILDKDDDLDEGKKKKGDGNLANNYPPYDKVTRGDVIAGAKGQDQKGGKKKKVKESTMSAAEEAYRHAKLYHECWMEGHHAGMAHHEDACKSCGGEIKHLPTGECMMSHGGNDYKIGEGLVGGLIGAVGGGAVAGVPGAIAGYSAGSKAGDDLAGETRAGSQAHSGSMRQTSSAMEGKKKKGDGNLANNYPPYDKVTRGDVIAGRLGKDQKGGKAKVKESQIVESIARFIAEDEEGKAKSITAGLDMVNDFTSWMQRVATYQTKSMIELSDQIRAHFGDEAAQRFKQETGTALSQSLESLTQSREQLSNAVAVLAGEAPAQDPMGADDQLPPPEADGMEPDMTGGDEFGASDAAAGGPETTGREMRESIERGNRLMAILGR
jgi:hypothetical protein